MIRKVLLFASVSLLVSPMIGQDKPQTDEYKVPAYFQFDYKVVYQVSDEDKNDSKTMTYLFTKSGDYMGMQPSEGENNDRTLMINTKDGIMLTFGEEHSSSKTPQKILTIMDMRHLMKDMGTGMSDLAKKYPPKDKPAADKKENVLDNFKKTGRTKQIFGYTAEEYKKTFTGEDKNDKMRSGTMSFWFAKVDFDPHMMFSMGMGGMAGPQAQSRMQQSHQNNAFGMGLTEKNYLLVETDIEENNGKSGTGMKVIDIGKTSFKQSTSGYLVKNFGGMGFKEMMNKQAAESNSSR